MAINSKVKKSTAPAPTNGSADTLKAIKTKQTKTEILLALAKETGLNRTQIKAVLTSLGALAKRHVMKRGSGEFALPELGVKLRRVQRKARMARNPMTGQIIRIPAKTVVRASVLKALKEAEAY
ncbi:MAG: HU family DNA-binding protein [Gammaproteobacteria bacterium]